MPFGKKGTEEHEHFKMIYEDMIKPIAEKCGYEPLRADEIEYAGSITADIIENINDSMLVIADLSEHNPNVFYELGLNQV